MSLNNTCSIKLHSLRCTENVGWNSPNLKMRNLKVHCYETIFERSSSGQSLTGVSVTLHCPSNTHTHKYNTKLCRMAEWEGGGGEEREK